MQAEHPEQEQRTEEEFRTVPGVVASIPRTQTRYNSWVRRCLAKGDGQGSDSQLLKGKDADTVVYLVSAYILLRYENTGV